MNYAGKFDATFPSEGPGTHSHAYAHVDSSQTHAPAGAIIVPDAQLLFHADYSRSGTDLILSRDHHEYVVHDYFDGEKRAPLASREGAYLTADIVKALVGEVEVSQAGTAPVASQVIGHVTKLQGSATVIRNGVSIILNMGDNVEKGDVVESGASSTVGITFIDGTVFGLSSNARMVLNEMVYDPNGSNNSSLLSLVAGTITFVAGETAKHGDMKIDTPVATMGIRGTAVLVEIDFSVPGQNGQPNASFQVLVEPDGTTGSYILFDKNTLQPIAIVNQAGQQININNGIINITTNPLSPDLQKLITDVFQQKFTDNSTNTKSTSPSTDSIIPTSSPLIIKTAEALITAQTVNVQGSSTSPPPTTLTSSTFHVSGPPIVHIGNLLGVETTHFLAGGELSGLTGSPLPDAAVGIVAFNDINVGDQPSVSAAFGSFTYKNAHGQDVTGGLSALQLADIAATEVQLNITPLANNTNVGSAIFSYSIADQAFDFLAAGEQITLTYFITVNENYAPDPTAKITIPITITITGTNDVPVITTSAQSITFTPSGTKTVGGDLKTTNPTSGTLAFTDVDLTDTHSVAAALTSAVMSNGGTVPPLPESVFEAALSAAIGIDSTGTGAGTINWQLSALPVYLSDFIPPGQTLTLTYTITVTDSQGATSTQTVTVIITGNNDPAVVWIHTTTDGHDNLWTTANNWETGTVPTSSNDAIIITDQLHPNTPAYPVTIDGTTSAAANSVTMNDFVNLPPELDVLKGGSLAIGAALSMSADSILKNAGTVIVGGAIELLDSVDSNNKFLALNQSVIVNSGTLKLVQGGDFQGSASITNTGTIDLTGGLLTVLVDIANSGTDANGKPVGGQITIEHGATLKLGTDTNTGGGNGGITGGTLTIIGELDLQGSNFVDSGTLSNSGNVFVTGLGNAFDAETITNTGTIELKSGAALAIDQGSSVSGSGTITIDGTATLTLNDVTISGNTINDNSSTAIDVTGSSKIDTGATLNSGAVTVEGGVTLTLDGITVNGTAITDKGTVVLADTVTLEGGASIAGSSTQLGTITNNGKLEIAGPASLTYDTLTNNSIIQIDSGKTLTLLGTEIIGGTINDNSSVGIDVIGSSKIDTGATLNNGSVTVEGGVTLTLDGITVNGTAITDKGTVVLADTVTLEGGASIAGSSTQLGTITNNGKLEIAGPASLTYDTLTNNSIIQIDSGKTLTLSGTEIIGGTINDNSSVGIDVIGSSKIDTGATLNNGGVTIAQSVILTLDGATVNGTSFVVDGVSQAPGELVLQDATTLIGSQITIDGDDELILDKATITGGSITNGDTIEVKGSSKIQGTIAQAVVTAATLSNGGVTVDAGQTLTLDNVTVTGTTFTDTAAGATLALDGGTQLTLNGVTVTGGSITDSGTVNVDGGNTLKLSGVALSGGKIGNAGTIEITGTGSIESDAFSNASLIVDANQILTLDGTTITGGTISDNGTIAVDGGNKLTLSAVALTGGKITNAGTIEVTGTGSIESDAFSNASLIVDANQTLTLDGTTITGGSISDNGTVNVDGGNTLTLSGVALSGGKISNAGTIEITGTGIIESDAFSNASLIVDANQTLTLDGTTITGGSITDSGTIAVDGSNKLTLSGVALTGGKISNAGTVEISGTGSIESDAFSNSSLIVDANQILTLDGTTITGGSISDNGTVKVDGGNKLTLSGVALTGGTITNLGTIEIAGTGSIESDAFSNASLIVDENQTLTLDGTTITGGSITDSGTIAVDGGNKLTLSGVALTGGKITNAGTVEITGTGSIESDAFSNASLIVDSGQTLTLDGTTITGGSISDIGTVNVDSGNTLKLSGVALSGGKITNAGTIEITGSGSIESDAFGNSSLIVDANQTLTLDGTTITGGSISNNGTLNVDGGNKLTLNGVTVTGGSITDNGTVEVDGTVKLTSGATIQGQSSTVLGVITNLGLLEILGAATLLDVTVTNTNNNFQVDANQTLDFDNSTITSGTLTVYGELDSTGTSFINNATIINQNDIHVISGTLTIDPTKVTNTGTIVVDSGAKLDLQSSEIDGGKITINGELDSSGNSTINGATIVDDGVIVIKDGTLTIDATSVLSGTGGFKIDGGSLVSNGALVGNVEISGTATVELGSSSSSAYSSTIITFDAGSHGTLKLDHAGDFGGNVAGFTAGQTLDLADISYASKPIVVYTGTAAGGVLEVYVNGQDVDNINLTGNHTGVQWVLSSDGQRGTDITESTVGVLAATLDHSTAQQGVTMHVTGVTDGGTPVSASNLSYAWQMSTDGKSWTTVGIGASFTPGEAQEGHFMQLVVIDTNAGTTQDVVYQLGMPNDLAVTVDQTTAQQGLPIHVTSVTDGGTAVSSGVTYLWETSTDDHTWTTVGHSSSYTPSFTSDGGKFLQLVVSYTDPGESESVTESFGTVALAKEWTGGTHSWETSAAWSPAGAPASTDNAVVDANGHYTVFVDQASTAAHSLVENASQATVEIAFGGKLTLGGNLVIDQGNLQVDLGGTLKDIASSATISGSFTNNGTVEAGGGKLEITDAVSGFGSFKIDSGATLQLDHASSENATFSGQGTLALEDPTHFSGIVSDSTGSLTQGDVLDLAGFDTKASVTYIGGTSLGVVVVSENNKVATIDVGSNTTHWTKPVSDGHGGILIEDPVENDAAPNANTSHAWSTAGADSFVFKTNPGANVALDANHSPVWAEPDHPDTSGKLAQFLQTHDAAGLPNLPGLLDTVTPDSLKTQLLSHHNEFHFV